MLAALLRRRELNRSPREGNEQAVIFWVVLTTHTLNGAAVEGCQQLHLQVGFPEDPQEVESVLCLLDYCAGVGGPGETFSDVRTQKPESRDPFHTIPVDV